MNCEPLLVPSTASFTPHQAIYAPALVGQGGFICRPSERAGMPDVRVVRDGGADVWCVVIVVVVVVGKEGWEMGDGK